ncbi:hypothetical protein B0H17DRAFT_1108695 [Mycena rosella]|uniref:Uncharacterized protein n=1 Tax=Mycena rosella TaxID=1033263 RepID=A0AAD7BVL6_MYCRO|nr:hypothetical protein B0H17DRAFT_1108695 [Mycena rosella]
MELIIICFYFFYFSLEVFVFCLVFYILCASCDTDGEGGLGGLALRLIRKWIGGWLLRGRGGDGGHEGGKRK